MAERPHRRAPPRLPAVQGRTSRSAGSRSTRTRCSTTRSCRWSSSSVIIGLAVVWKCSTPGNHTGTERGLAREAARRARPTRARSTSSRGPTGTSTSSSTCCGSSSGRTTVILGTIGIPTICLVLLLAIPFIDVRAERRLSRRPVAIIASILVVLSMGDPHLQGRDREGGARLGADREGPVVGRSGRASPATSRRSRAPSSSPSPAA